MNWFLFIYLELRKVMDKAWVTEPYLMALGVSWLILLLAIFLVSLAWAEIVLLIIMFAVTGWFFVLYLNQT